MRILALIVVLLAAAAIVPAIAHNTSGSAGTARNGQSMVDPNAPAVQIGGPFTLTAGDGTTKTDKDFHGKYMLVLFGFTFCPDICPTELQNAATALDLGGPAVADKTNIVLITVDPERDTPAKMGEYVRQFGNNITGLTGTPEQIAAVARAYKVYYARATETDPGDDEYLMDHSSFLYLMGPDGKYVSVFRAGTDPQEIANTIKAEIASH